MATKKQAVKIDFTKREATGTGVCRKIRVKNLVPAVLYGPEYKHGVAGTVSAKAISPVVNSERRETTLIELTLSDGAEASALIRDVQRHPLTQQIKHVDFYQVLKGHKIKVEIPVHIVNKDICKGIKEDGGVLNMGLRLIAVEIQPSDIPDEIDADIKDMELGSEMYVKDLALPEGAELLSDPDAMVFHVTQPKLFVEETPEETATEDEEKDVEVVAKGKAVKEEE